VNPARQQANFIPRLVDEQDHRRVRYKEHSIENISGEGLPLENTQCAHRVSKWFHVVPYLGI
jgi:hypothetical protein